MAGMTLIRTTDDWEQYTTAVSKQHGVEHVSWGNGPRQLPCLVASVFVPPDKFMSCYVYKTEASQLMQACGLVSPKQEVRPEPVPGHTLPDFAKSVAAHLLAMYNELESVSLTNRERYSELYLRFLAMVDQKHTNELAAIELSQGQQFILGQLFPGPNDNAHE